MCHMETRSHLVRAANNFSKLVGHNIRKKYSVGHLEKLVGHKLNFLKNFNKQIIDEKRFSPRL